MGLTCFKCSNSYVISNKKNILEQYHREEKLFPNEKNTVYKIYNIKTGKPAILKFFKKRKSFDKELYILTKMLHPNIVKILNYSLDQENRFGSINSFIIKEYAEYGDIYSLIEKNTFGLKEEIVKFITFSVLNALQYAYDILSVSHRDLKLENIFITSKGVIKLGDWGLSAFNVKNRKCNTFCGTDSYMSPEILLRKEYDSQKSDIWSLGVIIFILLSGNRPYEEIKKKNMMFSDLPYLEAIIKNEWSVWFNSQKRSKPNISNINNNFWYLFQNMLKFNPDERYTIKNTIEDIWLQGINSSSKEIVNLFH